MGVAVGTAHGQSTSSPAQPLALDTVVVTAQKRQQSDQDVPISMTVLDQRDLERARGNALKDIQQLVPDFSVERGAAFNALTIRGVGGGGNSMGFDPRVGVYVDGVYMGQAQALDQALFDVEQVEVLRGPQGYLYGRNTVAGAVNITTRAPTEKFDGYLRSVAGGFGTRESYATVSGPIAENVLAKISLASEARDGFITNAYDGQRLDDLQRQTARGQVILKPNDKLNISIAADASDTKQKIVLGEPITDLFGMPLQSGTQPKRTVDFNTRPNDAVKLTGGNLTANYTTDGQYVLTAILGYRETHQDLLMDNDYRANDLFRSHFVDDSKQASQEIRLASPNTGSTRYVAGLYHLNETANTNRKVTVGMDAATTLVLHPLFGMVPFSAVAGTFPGAEASLKGEMRTETTALFGMVDHDLTDALTLNLGARYTREKKDLLFNLDGTQSGNFAIGSLSNYRDTRSDNNFSPSVGATYAVSDNQNVYAKHSRGFKSGGWNTDFLSANAVKTPGFDTETVSSYELGTKGKLWGGRMRYDLAAYVSHFKNYQVSQFVNLGGGATSIELKNAAEVESRGIDAAVALRASQQLDLGFNFGLGNAVFKRFDNCSAAVDCTGHYLPYAPNFTSALTMDYGTRLPSLDGKLTFYGEYSYHGKSFSNAVNDPTIHRVPSRDLVNVRLGYAPDRSFWNFSLWVHNLFDKDTVVMRDRDFLATLTVKRMDPRVVGLEAKYSFN